MKRLPHLNISIFMVMVVLCCAIGAEGQGVRRAENAASSGTVSLFLARGSEAIVSPYVGTMHYLEFVQNRNHWIYPDIGYVDFGHGDYHELFVGAGRTLIDQKRLTWEQELIYVQAFGQAAHEARYIQPWSMLRVRFTPRLTSETVYFLYVPLNTPAQLHQVLERAKVEYAPANHWKIGAGYGAVKFAGSSLQNKPFVTTTLLTKDGAFEFWLQRVPGGAQVQLRYLLIRGSRQ